MQHISEIVERHKYTKNLLNLWENLSCKNAIPSPKCASKESQIFWVMSHGRRLSYQGLQSRKYILQEKFIFHNTMLMQISGILSYQKTKFADQLFSFEFNTEKSDGSIAIAVQEASDSCAAAVCLT